MEAVETAASRGAGALTLGTLARRVLRRELIRQVRECKTAAEERAVIARSSAEIRTALKDPEDPYRHRHVAKLMFMHMLGYPTHFGQMECVKLIATNSYPQKRIGYLALMLLLDERQEVTMLVTNSLKQDLEHGNQYIVGLALCALGNVCSAEMARDLYPEVRRLTAASSSYVKKKAALCADRVVHKLPELAPEFVESALKLLTGRAHGVLLTACTLALSLCQLDSGCIPHMRAAVPDLVRILGNLAGGGRSSEHDVGGVADPFLQVKVLKLMAVLGKGDAEASDRMGDVLAQVATSTSGGRSAGNAVLYECVRTIMSIESIGGQRVLAVNVLGKFLASRDNNIRYVALNTLAQVVAADPAAVMRHRDTIAGCVRDADASIRRRALELVCALVNEESVETLGPELLEYLVVCDDEFKADLADRLCSLVQKFAPNMQWQVDLVVDVLVQAGRFIADEAVRAFLAEVSKHPDVQAYATRALYRALFDNLDSASPGLATAAVWCIGEYGDALLSGTGVLEDETPLKVTEGEVVGALRHMLQSSWLPELVRGMALTALMKVGSRCPSTAAEVQGIVGGLRASAVLELQQRACEFEQMFQQGALRQQLLEPMPPVEVTDGIQEGEARAATGAPGAAGTAGAADDLADLLGGGDLLGGAPAGGAPDAGGADMLADLLGGDAPEQAAAAPAAPAADPLGDLLGVGSVATPPAVDPLEALMGSAAPPMTGAAPQSSYASQFPSICAYSKNGVQVNFSFTKPPGQPTVTDISASCTCSSPTGATGFSMQAAVPKFIQLTMAPVASNILPPNGSGQLTQNIRITNTMHGQKPIVLRLKIDFTVGMQGFSEVVEVSNFPPGL